MRKVLIYSHSEFDDICKKNGWNDDNVDSKNDIAFISIIGSANCLKFYLEEDASHWFASNHNNVLNLEFDDISGDKKVTWKGHEMTPMSENDAEKCVNFIENNIGKTFIIHCRAGKSRSQAFFRFITDFYKDVYSTDCGRKTNPCLTPNIFVLRLLKKAFYKKHNLFV